MDAIVFEVFVRIVIRIFFKVFFLIYMFPSVATGSSDSPGVILEPKTPLKCPATLLCLSVFINEDLMNDC